MKFRRYTDAHNYYIPNNGELHDPGNDDQVRRPGAVITGGGAPIAQPLTFIGAHPTVIGCSTN